MTWGPIGRPDPQPPDHGGPPEIARTFEEWRVWFRDYLRGQLKSTEPTLARWAREQLDLLESDDSNGGAKPPF